MFKNVRNFSELIERRLNKIYFEFAADGVGGRGAACRFDGADTVAELVGTVARVLAVVSRVFVAIGTWFPSCHFHPRRLATGSVASASVEECSRAAAPEFDA